MKKYISFIIISVVLMTSSIAFGFDQLDIFVPELIPADNNNAIDEEVQGADNGYEIIFNTVFRDISDATYEKEIIKMAAEGIVEKYGSYIFEPSKKITGYEALTFLVRFQGGEDVVQNNVLNNAQGLDLDTVQEMFNEEYLVQAQNAGIIQVDEVPMVNQDVTKEQLAQWIFRVSNLEEQFEDLSEVFGFKDWVTVDPSNRGIIQAVVNEGIMSYDNDGNFNPGRKVTRGEMAGIMDRLSESIYEERNITSNFGLVMDIVERTEGAEAIKEIFVRNADGTNTKITAIKNNENNRRNDFATYKNGVVSSSKNIAVGDEINYFLRNDQVYFAEVLDDQSVLDKINEINRNQENTDLLLATVKEISEEKHDNNETIISKKRFRLSTINGNTYDLLIDTDLRTGVTDDVLVFKEGQAAGTDLLAVGDTIEMLVSDDRFVIYIKVGDFKTQLVNGTVRSVNEKSIEVFDYNNRINTYPISPYNQVIVNNRPATIDDLSYGQDVSLEINNGFVTLIQSETFINPGYIPEFGKARRAEVYKRYNDGIYFLLNNGERELYQITNDTQILKEGRSIGSMALKEGDQVTLYFNDIYTDEVSKIEVDGRERLVGQVYKGTLQNVNQGSATMVLSNPSYLKNTNWEALDSYNKTINLDDRVKIYDGSKPVLVKDLLRDYKGEELYVVVEEAYGNEKGVSIAIKTGGEFVMSDRIDSVDLALGRMELENSQNVNYNEGTIVLKDGRIIDQSLLSKDDTVLVVSEFFQGQTTANLVKVTTMFDEIFNNFYIGTLENVDANAFTIRNYTSLDGNEFDEINPATSRPYYVFTESEIKDVTDSDDVVTLERDELFHGSYSRFENRSTDNDGLNYERFYTYFVTDGNLGIVSMNVRHKGLMANENIDDNYETVEEANEALTETLEDKVLTRGIIAERLDLYNRLKLTETYDYMGYRGGWVPNDSDTYFEHTDALIIKNNEAISEEDIEIGDYVYFLRINEDALVIFVEDE